jgi:hypothetical protein
MNASGVADPSVSTSRKPYLLAQEVGFGSIRAQQRHFKEPTLWTLVATHCLRAPGAPRARGLGDEALWPFPRVVEGVR